MKIINLFVFACDCGGHMHSVLEDTWSVDGKSIDEKEVRVVKYPEHQCLSGTGIVEYKGKEFEYIYEASEVY